MSTRRRRLGSVASPGLALGQFYPLSLQGTTPVSYGAAPARPQAFGFGSAGVGTFHQGWLVCSPNQGGGGGLEAQSARQRALALMARLAAAHSQCMQVPLWRAQSGGAELMSQVVATGATVRTSVLGREPERLPCRRVRYRALPVPWRWASQVGMTSLGRRGK